jgi:hypothetical protein
MYLYIELWKAKDAWLQLSTSERQAKIDQLLQEAKRHPITGVIPFSFRPVGQVFLFDGVTEQPVVIADAVARPTGYQYAAAWMIPARELIDAFEQRVENLGWWFDYFDQVNAWGVMDVAATVGHMINAQQGAPTPPQESPPQDSTPLGRLRRTEQDVRRLRQDVDELKKGVNIVVEYVQAERARSGR